ncbi:MAG: DEAD/DEAH box helicase [Opitutales bacterium]
MSEFATTLTVPDIWQQKAVNLLRADCDVVVNAPTGAGKTFVFEHFVEHSLSGQAVFTVPTRALANDKRHEWLARGWNVGIETGDVSLNANAPIVVATLETQKRALLTGHGPRLLVIDEYQMLADSSRGVNYEPAIAMAPAGTQLLLLSGSVANPEEVGNWLRRCGRNAVTLNHTERPVPLCELHLEALPNNISSNIHGRWARYIARALAANLGPILIFAPRRNAAEQLAQNLAAALEEKDPLILKPEQKKVADTKLARCLKNRIAYHHSGMPYACRAGLVENLAKTNQLKVIVATTGLAAGINFSMRSVLVLEREYRVHDHSRRLRPDELLQMFGRAGRRGLDERGAALFLDGKPRLQEAAPIHLHRAEPVDWPSLITVLQSAAEAGESPLTATRRLTGRLFTERSIRLGLEDFLNHCPSRPEAGDNQPLEQELAGGTVVEFQNTEGVWERRRAPVLTKLKETLFLENGVWRPGLGNPKILAGIRIGILRKTGRGRERRYCLDAPLARFPESSGESRLQLTKWLRKALREQQRASGRKANVPRHWKLENIEKKILPHLPELTRGGQSNELFEHDNMLFVRLDYAEAGIYAYRDLNGKHLLNPRQRKRRIAGSRPANEQTPPGARSALSGRSVAELWHALGLIDAHAQPTRRGIIFSFFNHGEGLAIAAGLETISYPLEELFYDLANIRAGYRFNALALAARPLTAICQNRYGLRNIPGYLRRGLPEDYGEGAGEIFFKLANKPDWSIRELADDELSPGDIERARTEWRSLQAHVAHAPDYDWERWRELQSICRSALAREGTAALSAGRKRKPKKRINSIDKKTCPQDPPLS